MPDPDLNGFREAQVTLIAKLGSNVVFFKPTSTQWPEDAILDPETGEPYDPTVAPTASGFASAVVRCGVVTSTVRAVDDALVEAIGVVEEGEAVLLVPEEDYEEAELDDATEAVLYGERYVVSSRDERGIGDETHRRLIWIQQK